MFTEFLEFAIFNCGFIHLCVKWVCLLYIHLLVAKFPRECVD